MLLFIGKATGESVRKELFQYISCYSLSRPSVHLYGNLCVSIHLMLLFINITQERWIHMAGFNTSHVTLYHLIKGIRLTTPRVSIHLMLLFIVRSNRHGCARWLFQYISCYSLSRTRMMQTFLAGHVSIHLMLLFIGTKTRQRRGGSSVSIHLMLLFISLEPLIANTFLCFNTSHVTLYPARIAGSAAIYSRFNTSHVTLYLGAEKVSQVSKLVSIHLMLLFIFIRSFGMV